MFNIELPKAKPAPIFVNDKARIKHIVDNCLIIKAGGLQNIGLIVANCRVVVEAAKCEAGSNVGEDGNSGGCDEESNQSNEAQLQGLKSSC
jgi:hypothetical protein